MKIDNASVLVTGADGFIGSHLVEMLLQRGCKVRAFVFYNSFSSWGWLDSLPEDILGQIDIFSGDIRDPHGVLLAMKGCDVVFHLAALVAIPFSYHSPDSYVDTNIKGTLNVLQRDSRINSAANSKALVVAAQTDAGTRPELRAMHIMLIPLRYAAPQGAIGASQW